MKVVFISFGERRSPIIFLYDINKDYKFQFCKWKKPGLLEKCSSIKIWQVFCLFFEKEIIGHHEDEGQGEG